MSPTQRSKAALQKEGWTVEVVEKWNPHVRQRKDLFGFADLLAIKPGEQPLLIQVTSGSNVAARRTKILENEHAPVTLAAGFRIEVHGWRKVKLKRGGKAMRWMPRIIDVTAGDFPQCPSKQCASSQTPND